MNNDLNFKKIFPIIMLIIWMIVIISFSSDTAIKSTGKSKVVEEYVGPVIQKLSVGVTKKTVPNDKMQFVIRKMAHIFNYGVLSMFAYIAFYNMTPLRLKASLFAIIYSSVFACIDEFYQTFISGRSGSIKDVMIDSIGIYLAVIGLNILITLHLKIKRKKTIRY